MSKTEDTPDEIPDSVAWFDEFGKEDIEKVGGKAASLGEMRGNGLPVPPGFTVTAQAYRRFIQETGIEDELFEATDIDPDESSQLGEAESRARELILGAEMPEDMVKEIEESYQELGDDAFVAVRSSATAEDLPDASFAGQQDTYLNVRGGENVVRKVKECWASLFTKRAIYYREENGFDHRKVDIAVVVQEMVDAEKSGVMFTSHPSTGEAEMTIEAAWGLGEAVVSGAVSPDNYTVDRDSKEVPSATIAVKKLMHVKDEETGETVEREVSEDKQEERVLSEEEILELVEIGEKVEDHYGEPQDVEWAMVEGDIYVLQSRPITTIKENEGRDKNGEDESEDDIVVEGLGAAPGVATGRVRIVEKLDELDKVEEGDVLVTGQTTPDMVPAMKRSSGIITDEGGLTSHAAIVSRELGKTAVVGTTDATEKLEDGDIVTLDGDKGIVRRGGDISVGGEESEDTVEKKDDQTVGGFGPVTATDVKVNVSIPSAAERASSTGADGVGLLRIEHMILGLGKTPEKYVGDHGERAYIDELVDGIQKVADAFYPRPVRVRTLDAPTDEFRNMEGGDDEPTEHNPMLGYRGIRRSLDEPSMFELELRAFKKLYELGYDNVEIMLPLVNDADDTRAARRHMENAGIDLNDVSWGVMIETPSSALVIEEILEEGVDFVSFGTNDLTQYTLAVDRNNENVADLYDELHPAVLSLIERVVEACNEHDVKSSICGQAGSKPEMVNYLVERGITSISANIDAVSDVRNRVARVERKMMLDRARNERKK